MTMMHDFDSNVLGFTNQILSDYLSGDTALEQFYNHAPNIDGIEQTIIEKQKENLDRNTLVKVLLEQLSTFENKGIDLEKSKANILKLSNNNSFTITTGQQLHLYLGPGYFGNKIFSCIKLCNYVSQNLPGYVIVPVFWLASEDHDTQEISHVELFGETYSASLPENVVTGRINTKHVKLLTETLSERLGVEADNFDFFQICKSAYETFDNLADATAGIIYELFGKYGIVVINADNEDLKKAFNPIAKNEIENLTSSVIQEEVRITFDAHHWHYQLMPRGNNLFVINDDNTRQVEHATAYAKDKTYSPNALLRPLYQELILPNIAYVGGKAEVNYWLQLKPIFDFYKVAYPVVWLRESICLTNEKQWNKFLQTGQSARYFSQLTEQEIERQFLKDNYDTDFIGNIEKIKVQLKQIAAKNENKAWETIQEEYELWLASVKVAYRTVKSDLLKQKHYTDFSKQYMAIKALYFASESMQERQTSLLTLAKNYDYLSKMDNFLSSHQQRHGTYCILVN